MSKRCFLGLMFLLALLSLGIVFFATGSPPDPLPPEIPDADLGRLPESPTLPVPEEPDELPSKQLEPAEIDLVVRLTENAFGAARQFDPGQGGRNASLRGAVTDAWGGPVPATLRFVAGMNQGVETSADAGGQFEFPSLFPGLHQLEISGKQGSILREVRLAPDGRDFQDFQFGALSTVMGVTVDRRGKPVEGAKVEIDGRAAWSDREGRFALDGVFPGEVVLYAKADGFAAYRQNLTVPPNYRFEAGRIQIVLPPGGTLSGGVYPVGGSEPVLLYLVPNLSTNDRSFPFERFYGIEVPAGGSFSIENVPTEKSFNLFAFHARSAAQPPMRPVLLRGRTENIVRLDFRFTSARPVQGRVLGAAEGKPVRGARVRVLSLNPYATISQTLKFIGPGMGGFLVPMLPSCRKEVQTDAEGKFFLEAGDGAARSETVFFQVSAEGHVPFEKTLSGNTLERETIVLYTPQSLVQGASLEVRFRPEQPVDLQLTLNGSGKDRRRIGAGEPFRIEGLAVGIYQVEARHEGRLLLREEALPLSGKRTLEAVIPRY